MHGRGQRRSGPGGQIRPERCVRPRIQGRVSGEIRRASQPIPAKAVLPPGPLATPDLIKCHWVPNAAGHRSADDFSMRVPPRTSKTSLLHSGDRRLVSAQCTCSWPTNIDVVETTPRAEARCGTFSANRLLLVPPIRVPPGAHRGACRCGCCRRRFGGLALRFGVGRWWGDGGKRDDCAPPLPP